MNASKLRKLLEAADANPSIPTRYRPWNPEPFGLGSWVTWTEDGREVFAQVQIVYGANRVWVIREDTGAGIDLGRHKQRRTKYIKNPAPAQWGFSAPHPHYPKERVCVDVHAADRSSMEQLEFGLGDAA